jgi:hypothetical protein
MQTAGAEYIADVNRTALATLLARVIHPEYESSLELLRKDMNDCGFGGIANNATDAELIALLDSLGYGYDDAANIVEHRAGE